MFSLRAASLARSTRSLNDCENAPIPFGLDDVVLASPALEVDRQVPLEKSGGSKLIPPGVFFPVLFACEFGVASVPTYPDGPSAVPGADSKRAPGGDAE